MKGFKTVLNVIIIVLALQSLFFTVNLVLNGILNTNTNMGSVGNFDIKELMYPIFFLAGIYYYKKANEKPMIFVSSIGLLSRILLIFYSMSSFRG